MPDESTKITALEKVAKAWSDAGIVWAVANGLEDYPDGIGRDLDIVVGRGSLRNAVEVVIACLGEAGWVVVPNRQGWIWWVVAFRENEDGSLASLQVDLFEHLQWAFTWVVEGVGMDGRLIQRGPFFEDPGAGLAKRFLLHALSSGSKAFRKKPAYLVMSELESVVLPVVLRRVSGCEWPELMNAVKQFDLPILDRQLEAFRKACYRHALRSHLWGRRFWSAFQKQWVVNLAPKQGAPVIEVRGSQKSIDGKVIEILQSELESLVFQKVQLVDESMDSGGRALRRLSCLQVVLVFVGMRSPRGLTPDLLISHRENGCLIQVPVADKGSEAYEFSLTNLRQSLMVVFKNNSQSLMQRHSLRSTNPNKSANY
ncbi:hypothetical protein N9062_00495 [Akkermansiaceae bacterium]|nr:hypothetical protein [Akkermansiaceae bacterium]MDB4464780.1 hypothetical protein [Akkermansiaceae bacterium]MDB4488568.1 hypothetical protein [Akkermansiaceae bacterium]MDB4509456.1 hypothetical protein [Akkermansiaceae bacterium]